MGRKPLFQQKAEHIMISVSPEDKKYALEKGISPSVFYHEALERHRKGTNTISKDSEFQADLEKVRVIFVKSERGLCQKDSYFKAIQIFMEKWQDITKPEVMALVERPRYYTEREESKEVEKEGEINDL